jgi:hypothetical protein
LLITHNPIDEILGKELAAEVPINRFDDVNFPPKDVAEDDETMEEVSNVFSFYADF